MQKHKSQLSTLSLLVILLVCASGALVLSEPLNAQEQCNNKKCKKVKHNSAAPAPPGTIFCGDCPAAEDGIARYRNCKYIVAGGGTGYMLESAQGWNAVLDGGESNAKVSCERYTCSACTYRRVSPVGDAFTIKKNCQHDNRWVKKEDEEKEEGQ